MGFHYDGISLQNGRSVNMDSLIVNFRRVQKTELCLAAVCDGVGSLNDGAFAASAAVQMLNNWFENLEDTSRLGIRLRDYIFSVNLGITRRAQKRGIRTASTLSCLLLWENQYVISHVGDSRIYTLEDNGLLQLTQDQVRNGRLAASVGNREETEVFYTEGLCRTGQKFLVCSDGLYKRMDLQLLAGAMKSANRHNLQERLDQMAKYVIGRGEQDNVTAALIINE